MNRKLRIARVFRGHLPFVRLLLLCMLGVGMAYWVEPDPEIDRWLRIACCTLAVGGLVGLILRSDYSRGGLIVLLFLFLYSWVRTWAPDPRIDSLHFSRSSASHLLAYLSDEPQVRDRHVRARVEVMQGMDFIDSSTMEGTFGNRIPLRGSIQMTIERDRSGWADSLRYGQVIVFSAASVRSVNPPRNPGEMDYARYLASQNCWHQVYLREGEVHLLPGFRGSWLQSHALRLRESMVGKFSRYVPDEEARAIASTLILGYRADLSRELMEMYSATGTIHVLSVSGMHVVIVFWLLAKLLFWMDLHPRLQRLRFPLLIVAIWGYALLTGFSPSVLRAALMLSFVLWAQSSLRIQRTYNSIGASAFFLLLYDPKLLLNIGFQLSYLAVLGIVFFHPLLSRAFDPGRHWLRPVTEYSAMSVAAQAGAFPLAMYYFHQFPVYFLLANLVIVLPASLIMYLGFAVLLVPEWGVLEGVLVLLGQGLRYLILGMNAALAWIQGLPAASLTGLETTLLQCVLLYGIMLLAAFARIQRSGRYLLGGLLLTGVLMGTAVWKAWDQWAQRRLVIFQLRNALAIGLTGRGETVLYTELMDPNDRALQFSVAPYLRTFSSWDRVSMVPVDSSYLREGIRIEARLIQVGARRMYVYDGRIEGNGTDSRGPPLEADLLLIRGNPRKSLEEILVAFPSRQLVLDGSNHDWTLDRLTAECADRGLPCYRLKDNFAYIWVLDEEPPEMEE